MVHCKHPTIKNTIIYKTFIEIKCFWFVWLKYIWPDLYWQFPFDKANNQNRQKKHSFYWSLMVILHSTHVSLTHSWKVNKLYLLSIIISLMLVPLLPIIFLLIYQTWVLCKTTSECLTQFYNAQKHQSLSSVFSIT
jgi:hypothetical protein